MIPRKGAEELYNEGIYIKFNIDVSLYLAPYGKDPEKYFTLKNFFWSAEPMVFYLFEGAKLVLTDCKQ
jgi:hypothetical protein